MVQFSIKVQMNNVTAFMAFHNKLWKSYKSNLTCCMPLYVQLRKWDCYNRDTYRMNIQHVNSKFVSCQVHR